MAENATAAAHDDARRQRPIKIRWEGMIGRLYINDELWGAIEWSDKRQAWCIEDAWGQCLSHHSHIHGIDKDKDGAIALAEAMIHDGRLPSPEAAYKAREERLSRDRERRAKQPAQIRKRQQSEEKMRYLRATCEAEYEDGEAEETDPLHEIIADVVDLASPELWKSNSFARLRARLIVRLRAVIADLEYSAVSRSCSFGPKKEERLARAKELLAMLMT
jgi:hypothetical protein